MTSQDHARLLSERSALQRMIQQTPADDVLDLGSLTARLEEIEHCIARAGGGTPHVQRPAGDR